MSPGVTNTLAAAGYVLKQLQENASEQEAIALCDAFTNKAQEIKANNSTCYTAIVSLLANATDMLPREQRRTLLTSLVILTDRLVQESTPQGPVQ